MKSLKVMRHSLTERVIHWSVALSGLVLLFSGIGQLPMYKRYNIIKLPGLGWADNYEITLIMHYIAAAVFGAAILFHIVYHWRRKEFAAMPKKGDVKESVHIIKAIMTGQPEPPHEKFLAEQRLAYAAIGVVSLVLLVTGFIKVFKNLGPITFEPWFITAVTLIHTVATPIFLFLVIAHLGAFVLKANWPLLPSMLTGHVSQEYAKARHGRWNYRGERV